MSFPRYSKYRDSGIEWLGHVPAHWETCALKRIVRLQSGETITSDDISDSGDFPVYGGGGLRGFASNYTHDGEFALIGRQGALCGNINYGCGRFWASEHAVVANPIRPLRTRWLGELLRAMDLNQYSVSAAQPGLSVDLVGRLRIVVPPLPEQSAIATFLDRETAKIDALIAEQQRLMELLQEKRQAVISHAVTKGLNPDAPMKPSGVEWLGEVPAHWMVARVKDVFSTCSGATPDTSKRELYYADGGAVPWVRTTDLKNDVLHETPVHITERALRDTACSVLPVGSVMIAMYGGDGTVGKNGLLAIPAAVNQAVCALLPTPKYDPEFIWRYMQFVRPYWMIGAESSRKDPNISQQQIREAPLPYPPLEEQRGIVAHVSRLLRELDGLAEASNRAIDLLRERRSALITAAVTGQIDVRAQADEMAA